MARTVILVAMEIDDAHDDAGRVAESTHRALDTYVNGERPEHIRVAVMHPEAEKALWMAASVGLDGADEATTGLADFDLTRAWEAVENLSSIDPADLVAGE